MTLAVAEALSNAKIKPGHEHVYSCGVVSLTIDNSFLIDILIEVTYRYIN